MEYRKEATRILLAEGLKTVMQRQSFEKITIKMITDEAGVIRPTFYHYFQDKYELLEWIFEEEVVRRVREVLDVSKGTETIRLFFVLLSREKPFYRKALEIKGQNSFEEILYCDIYRMFLEVIREYGLKDRDKHKHLTPEWAAAYYANGLANVVKFWLLSDEEVLPEHVADTYFHLLTHSVFDIVDRKK